MKTGTAVSPAANVETKRLVSIYSEWIEPWVIVRHIRTASDLECKNGSEVRRAELLELSLESETTLKNCWEVWWWYRAGECFPCRHGCVSWCLKCVRLLLIYVFASHAADETYYLV